MGLLIQNRPKLLQGQSSWQAGLGSPSRWVYRHNLDRAPGGDAQSICSHANAKRVSLLGDNELVQEVAVDVDGSDLNHIARDIYDAKVIGRDTHLASSVWLKF